MGRLLGRYAPLVGGAVLVASSVLRLFGQEELASYLFGLGGVFGLTAQSPVPMGEIVAAVAVVAGIVRKFLATLAGPKA